MHVSHNYKCTRNRARLQIMLFLPVFPTSFWGDDIIFILHHFFILILLPLYKQLHQCNPRIFQRREKSLTATQEAGEAMFPVEYRSQKPYSIAEGGCKPSSSPSLFSWQLDPAQTHSLQCPGDVLLG